MRYLAKSSLRRAAVVTVALAALTVSCGTTPKPDTSDKPAGAAPAAPASKPSVPTGDTPAPIETADTDRPSEPSEPSEPSGRSALLVRDAFAGLQATLGESCGTPGNCAYFLGRVYDELHGLDGAMKADPKGPGHFTEPIAWIKKLDTKLAGDRSFENLKKNQKLLIGTRDKINTWMQGHPDDYR
ncbi:hypothetical protein ACH4SP_22170 [Streptomyces sp. NPDC021093]|uniref:hypothetical protein n=1 Tax=Streptomyces sp. NPDC021093 TaxID=3365112 RepID=UPI003791BB21